MKVPVPVEVGMLPVARSCLFAALVAACAACSGGESARGALDVPRIDLAGGADVITWGADGDGAEAPSRDAPEEGRVEAADLAPVDAAPEGDAAIDGADVAPCTGDPGCPCTDDTACTTGVCAESRQGVACAAPCLEGLCPEGLRCVTLVGAFGPESVCLDPYARLCRPCRASAECAVPRVPGGDARCLARSAEEGSFCATTCDADSLCPAGYTCRMTDMAGEQVPLCRPVDNGACPCPAYFAAAGWATDCARANALGTCMGVRTCDQPCSAPEPAPEICNGIDDDCDGDTDPPQLEGCTPFHADRDGDGVGDPIDTRCLCAPQPPFSLTEGGDCDDGNGDVSPDAADSCNGRDDDCDGVIDGLDAAGCVVYLDDPDGDGFAAPGADACCLCVPLAPYTAQAQGDCAPGDAGVSPAAVEACNGRDDDCDGQTDVGEDTPGCVPWYVDHDGDGQGNDADARCLCGPLAPHEVALGGDCADDDPDLGAHVAELCNGDDDDCDGQTDEDDAIRCTIGYRDSDGDGAGDPQAARCMCTPSSPFLAPAGDDCDDGEGALRPGADETCDGRDEDCDGQTDEDALGCQLFWLDQDQDGRGAPGSRRCLCAPAAPFTAGAAGDCDDGDAAVGAPDPEVCGGGDEDCDGMVDEEGAEGCVVRHPDADEDGVGGEEARCLCTPVAPWVAFTGGDCDDSDPLVGPARPEQCDGRDDDCDSLTDEADALGCVAFFADPDGDGRFVEGAEGACLCAPAPPFRGHAAGDCAEGDPGVYEGAPESCDGRDEDCDGQTDEEGAAGCTLFYEDADQDGYGRTQASRCLCAPEGSYTATAGGDCDDADPLVAEPAREVCNGLDDDCDDLTDEGAAEGCGLFFEDLDVDGYGADGAGACLCAPLPPHVAGQAGDCDDARADVHPGAPEACGGGDEDCDGATDEGDALGCQVFLRDGDGDLFGVGADGRCSCEPAAPYSATQAGDCRDDEAGVHPGVVESCDGLDQDCDGVLDPAGAIGCRTRWRDEDGDGYGAGEPTCVCAPVAPWTALVGGDCDDGEGAVHPAQAEVCNGVDDNCSGGADEGPPPCAIHHASAACVGGACEIVACANAWCDGNGQPVDGCEVSLNGNPPCSASTALAARCGDDASASEALTGRGEALYRLRVDECRASAADGDPSVRFELSAPADMDYDLFLYDVTGGVDCAALSVVRKSVNPGYGVSELIEHAWPDADADDGRLFLVFVKFRAGSACGPWSLAITNHPLRRR